MRKNHLKLFILMLLFFFSEINPQKKDLDKNQQELLKVRNQIENLRKEINTFNEREKRNYKALDKLNEQIFLLNKIIGTYRNEVDKYSADIKIITKQIESLQKEISELKTSYSSYITFVYRSLFVNKLSYVLNAKSMQQALQRYRYLKYFSEKSRNDIENMKSLQNDLAVSKEELSLKREGQLKVISEKQNEERNLAKDISYQKQLITKLRNEKSAKLSELNSKQKAEQQIRNLIAKLIEQSTKQKTKTTTSTQTKSDENESNDLPQIFEISKNFSSFSALRGRMSWPVGSGTIFRNFGSNKNEKLNTVTLNYGLDIKVKNDFGVKVVADGIVSVINWLPGYGSVVIITHKDDYRTVYGHLSNIYVNEGDVVKAGKIIGNVGESLDGYILHFEIWHQRNNQDPNTWLAKR